MSLSFPLSSSAARKTFPSAAPDLLLLFSQGDRYWVQAAKLHFPKRLRNQSRVLWKALSAIYGNAASFKHPSSTLLPPQANLFWASPPQTHRDAHVCHRVLAPSFFPGAQNRLEAGRGGAMPHSKVMVGRRRASGDVAGPRGIPGVPRHPMGKPPADTSPGDGFARGRNREGAGTCAHPAVRNRRARSHPRCAGANCHGFFPDSSSGILFISPHPTPPPPGSEFPFRSRFFKLKTPAAFGQQYQTQHKCFS